MSYFNAIYADSNDNPVTSSHDDANAAPQVKKLEFSLNATNKADIDAAKAKHDEATSKLCLDFLEYEGLGKNDLKPLKLSPDSVMQLSFQMAYKKAYGSTPATYESSSTSAFKHGRTETVRPATLATNAACELLAKLL
ncbi:CPT2 [Bugula neritina]|uniref:CPT2 n=1 Tax=Bugula neritina TaxID=10212 RepID=A0A7J7IT82_BUGNE|nr:CPT2 [Bugula neritina]